MKKKIMFFINTMAGGGAERVLVNLLKVLDYSKYDVTVITVIGGENLKDIPPDVTVRQIIKSKNKLSAFLVKILYNIPKKWFASLFLRGKFDIEISYLPGFPTRVLAAKKSAPDTKKIAFIHGSISKEDMGILGYSDTKSCLSEYLTFSKVCFVSEAAKNFFESQVGKLSNAMVLYNVLNYDEIKAKSSVPIDISYTTKGTKLIAVGRLVEIKGFERLLRVVNELKDSYDFELWILGQGHLHEKLDNYISINGLDNVRLLGYHENPYAYIRQADYFICSSFSEGYSTAAVESLVLGVPVITTDCAGMKEILKTDKYGYIAENSELGIKAGLKYVLDGEENTKEILKNVREYSENCDIHDELDCYTKLFDTI